MRILRLMDTLLRALKKKRKLFSFILLPFSNSLNNFMIKTLPIIEPGYLFILKIFDPILNRLSKKILKFVENANPIVFQNKKEVTFKW